MIKRSALILACAFGSLIQTDAFAAPGCSTRSLRGTYIYHLNGKEAGADFAAAGIETFDGRGNGAAKQNDSDGHAQTTTSTYIIHSDCSGEITYSSGEHNHIFVDPNGEKFTFILDDDTGTGTGSNWYVGEETRVNVWSVKFLP